ncbi:hypothetical protein RQP46_003566 [Phenoliferia psychrophenolica]
MACAAHLAEVILFIDQNWDHLEAVVTATNTTCPPAMQNACLAGLKITNKYYSLTNSSAMYPALRSV